MIQSRDDSDCGKGAEGNNRVKQEVKKKERKNAFYFRIMQKERVYRFIVQD